MAGPSGRESGRPGRGQDAGSGPFVISGCKNCRGGGCTPRVSGSEGLGSCEPSYLSASREAERMGVVPALERWALTVVVGSAPQGEQHGAPTTGPPSARPATCCGHGPRPHLRPTDHAGVPQAGRRARPPLPHPWPRSPFLFLARSTLGF